MEERLTAWPIGELVEPYLARREASGEINRASVSTLRSDLRHFVASVGAARRGGAVSVREAAQWARKRGCQETQRRRARTAVAFLDWVHADGRPRRREPSTMQVVLSPTTGKQDAQTGPVTVADLVDRYLRERVARRDLGIDTARNHRSALLLFAAGIGDRDPSTLERGDVERWLETRAGRRPNTARSQFSYLRTFLTWLVEQGILLRNPCDRIKAPRVPRPAPRAMPSNAIGALLEVCPDARARAIVWLMIGMALRCCEVQRLQVFDWDRSSATMHIRGKGNDERIIPVPEEVSQALDAYLTEHPPIGDGPLIRTYRRANQPLKADTISGMVSRWMEYAGLKRGPRDGVSAHALRHSCASLAFERTKDIRVAQELLGHTNLAVTSRYIRPAGVETLREALAGRTYAAAPADPAGPRP
jgi:site-specific recombinase XerC